MPRTSMLAVAAALALMTGPADRRELAQAQRHAFRAGVDLISLSVTVTELGPTIRRRSSIVTTFVVLEDGVPQQLTFFGKTNVPLALALLLDTSASMELTLATAQEAAIGFVRQLEPSDVATVVDFDSRVQILHDFTANSASLEEAIRRTSAGGSTALYNAMYIALKELNKVRPEDEHAARLDVAGRSWSCRMVRTPRALSAFEEVLDLASRSDTVIYAIGLARDEPAGRPKRQDATFILRRLAQQTGGRAFFPQDVKDLAGVYGDIREELSSQYSLAYESSSSREMGNGAASRFA